MGGESPSQAHSGFQWLCTLKSIPSSSPPSEGREAAHPAGHLQRQPHLGRTWQCLPLRVRAALGSGEDVHQGVGWGQHTPFLLCHPPPLVTTYRGRLGRGLATPSPCCSISWPLPATVALGLPLLFSPRLMSTGTIKKDRSCPGPGGSVGWSIVLCTKWLPV